jgi:hypothetical protein
MVIWIAAIPFSCLLDTGLAVAVAKLSRIGRHVALAHGVDN